MVVSLPPQSFGGQFAPFGISGTEIDLASNFAKGAAEVESNAFAPPVTTATLPANSFASIGSLPGILRTRLPNAFHAPDLRDCRVGYHIRPPAHFTESLQNLLGGKCKFVHNRGSRGQLNFPNLVGILRSLRVLGCFLRRDG